MNQTHQHVMRSNVFTLPNPDHCVDVIGVQTSFRVHDMLTVPPQQAIQANNAGHERTNSRLIVCEPAISNYLARQQKPDASEDAQGYRRAITDVDVTSTRDNGVKPLALTKAKRLTAKQTVAIGNRLQRIEAAEHAEDCKSPEPTSALVLDRENVTKETPLK